MLLKWNWCRKFRCTLPLRYIALKQIMEKGSKKIAFFDESQSCPKGPFFVPNSSSDISSGLHKSDFRFQTVASFSSLKSSCSDDGESSFEASVSWIYLPSFSNPLLRWIAEKKKKTKKRKTNELFFFSWHSKQLLLRLYLQIPSCTRDDNGIERKTWVSYISSRTAPTVDDEDRVA